MEKIEKYVNNVLLYTILILICLKTTLLYNYIFLNKLLPIVVCISFVLIILNYKKFNKEYIKNNYLIITYFIIRLISIIINKGKILNIKSFIYEIFFLVIVKQLFCKEKSNIINISKIIVVINLLANIISVIYQYIFQKDFSRELFGIYTNPNIIASFTIISLILYDTFLKNEKKKIFNYIYMLFCIIIVLLSKSRTSMACLVAYLIIKILIYKKISLNNIKIISSAVLIGSLALIIGLSYFNSSNLYPTKLEIKLNNITTNRYYLWKYSIISLEKEPIFGIGAHNIGEYRKEYISEELIKTIDTQSRKDQLESNNNHNGYLQLMVGNGYICFCVFMITIFKSMKRMNSKTFSILYPILIMNLFESQLVLSQNIFVFLLMYILNSKEQEEC